MSLRVLALAALFPLASFCQIQLFLVNPDGSETPVGGGLSVGTAAVGDTLQSVFRIRNVGTQSVIITTITLSSSGDFTLAATPDLPDTLATAGAPVDFTIDFSSSSACLSCSASLGVNSLTTILRATATPQAAGVYIDGSTISLDTGAAIDFGSVQAGSTSSHTITVDNSSGTGAVPISISGAGFQAPALPTQGVPAMKTTFTVTFMPPSGQAYQGTLNVDQRTFILQGQGITPATPTARILVNSGKVVTSAQQVNVTIPLSSAAQGIDTGTLTLQFQPTANGAADDSAIQFMGVSPPPEGRSAGVRILPGDTTASISGNPSIALQTGTTSGTILLVLKLSNSGSQVSIPIPPVPVLIETEGGVVSQSELTISLNGFDNTRSLSQLVFTFYDTNNNPVSPGTITMDATSMFQNYFAEYGGQYGGLFSLNAAFPVTGNITLISTAQVALTNSAGVTQTQRIVF
jgi:hypothetical protein